MVAPKFTWAIVRQVVNQTTNDLVGDTVVGTYVYYRTGYGNSGVIFVPDNLYSVEYVRNAVRADAKRLDEVGRLLEGME